VCFIKYLLREVVCYVTISSHVCKFLNFKEAELSVICVLIYDILNNKSSLCTLLQNVEYYLPSDEIKIVLECKWQINRKVLSNFTQPFRADTFLILCTCLDVFFNLALTTWNLTNMKLDFNKLIWIENFGSKIIGWLDSSSSLHICRWGFYFLKQSGFLLEFHGLN